MKRNINFINNEANCVNIRSPVRNFLLQLIEAKKTNNWLLESKYGVNTDVTKFRRFFDINAHMMWNVRTYVISNKNSL